MRRKVYISEAAYAEWKEASKRLTTWMGAGEGFDLLDLHHEAKKEGLKHHQMTEKLVAEVFRAQQGAELEQAGERARKSAAVAIVTSIDAEAG